MTTTTDGVAGETLEGEWWDVTVMSLTMALRRDP